MSTETTTPEHGPQARDELARFDAARRALAPVQPGQSRRFRSTLLGEERPGVFPRRYTGQDVTVVRDLSDECDPEVAESDPLWLVRASDGVEFSAWESELVPGGLFSYVLPDGTDVEAPDWSGPRP